MLGSRFDSSKCKNQCRLCVARIKLLRNKKNVQLRNMHKEVAELLRQKKRDNARIRVEASIRERMTLQAFEILELFLELIEVRSQLLETTKGLPADMVEVVSSVVYAAQRMGQELPELLKLRTMFTVKYGKEFVQQANDDTTAHTHQVNEQLRANLSLEPPSAHEKAKELQEIAEAHGVDTDNLYLEASTPPPIPEVPQQMVHQSSVQYQQQPDQQQHQQVQSQQGGGGLDGFLTQGVHQHPQYPPQSISDMEVSQVGGAPVLPVTSPQPLHQHQESAKQPSYTDAMAAALAADKAAQEARSAADFAQQYVAQYNPSNNNQESVMGSVVVGPPDLPPPPAPNMDFFDEEKVRQEYEAAPGPPTKGGQVNENITIEAPPPPSNTIELPSAPTQIPGTGPKVDELDQLRARFDMLKKT
eukprot:TRINITY_DN13967_c0_g1_i1.p1 TRINITY_DN13967_c0_g1~~TRINITY_DN13967_c0_g1_i1.p1  ORF type:complete len:446 (+),score=75.75 TRINITY_DN13967_c0_g1_i1:91-1338(+)